jgi:hypothetical protein
MRQLFKLTVRSRRRMLTGKQHLMAPHQVRDIFSVDGLNGQAEVGRFQAAFFERFEFGINMFHIVNFERMIDRRGIFHGETGGLLAVFQLKYAIVEQQYRGGMVEGGRCQNDIEHLLDEGAAVRRFAQDEQKLLHAGLTEYQKTVGALDRFHHLPEAGDPEARSQVIIEFALPFGLVAA